MKTIDELFEEWYWKKYRMGSDRREDTAKAAWDAAFAVLDDCPSFTLKIDDTKNLVFEANRHMIIDPGTVFVMVPPSALPQPVEVKFPQMGFTMRESDSKAKK